MTKEELKPLQSVVKYFWNDEQRHFEDMEAGGDDPGDHVFLHLLVLDGCLTRQAEI